MSTQFDARLSPAPQQGQGGLAPDMFSFMDECHREIQRQLVELRELVEEFDSGGRSPAVDGRADKVLKWFSEQARQHHLDEEKHVFPVLLASGDAEIIQAANRLIQDHGWLEEDWIEIEPALSAAAEGYSWFDPTVLRHAVDVFEQLYLDHIVLEEELAYPQARSRIAPGELEAMGREMAKRRAVREAQTEKRRR